MFKKLSAVLLMVVLTISVASVASADVFDEKSALLNEYVTLLTGTWHNSFLYAKTWDGMKKDIELDASCLSIGGDNRIYCQWDDHDYKGNGGEILLTTSKDKIGIVFEANGITTVVYYKKATNK